MNRTVLAAVAATVIGAGAYASSPQQSTLYSSVYSPYIPAKAELCGQSVDLDRVDMYERMDRELTAIIYTHGSTLLVIKRANRYFPQLAPILKRNGVPLDLLYLACTESLLNPRAYSAAKAAGIWQFVPATAKEYGLEVSDEVDERYNIEKETEAACRYFKKALARYGDWPSVMAAFNGGMSRITSELDKQQGDDAFDLFLAEETQRYPFRVMAYKVILENPARYGFKLSADQLYFPRECRTVTVDGPVEDWVAWAEQYGISYAELRDENPWIRAKTLTNKSGKTYTVRIPSRNSLSRSKQARPIYNQNWVTR